jgi:hypothetical protein
MEQRQEAQTEGQDQHQKSDETEMPAMLHAIGSCGVESP